jgi:hypothetical protein
MFYFRSTWITWICSKCTFIPFKIHVKSNIDRVSSTLVPFSHHLQCVPCEVTFCHSTPDSMRWLYLKVHMLSVKEKCKCIFKR